jgi:hypothetical protein
MQKTATRDTGGSIPIASLKETAGETTAAALREASERGFKLLQKSVVPETLREAIVAELAAG